MIDSSVLIHIWQLFISSFLVFFIFACLIEVSLLAFKIQNPRMRAFFRLIPLLKLPFDFVIYRLFLTDSLKNFNLLDCQGLLHRWIVEQLPEKVIELMQAKNCTSISGLIGSLVPHVWLQNFALTLLTISLGILLYRLFQFAHSTYALRGMCLKAKRSNRSIENAGLREKLEKSGACVLISDEISVPMALHNRAILVPKTLARKLSQREYEAVLAHELEHVRWKDPQVRLLCALVSSFFWWIPTKWWLTKIELEQENASDASLYKYDLDSLALASAVVKAIGTAKNIKHQVAPCYLISRKSVTFATRLHTILNNKVVTIQNQILANCCMTSTCISFIFLRCWIC